MPRGLGLEYRGGVAAPTAQQTADQRVAVAAAPSNPGTAVELHPVIDWASGPKLATVAIWTSTALALGSRDLTFGAIPATAGEIRLPSEFEINARSSGDLYDVPVAVLDSNDYLYFGDNVSCLRTFLMGVNIVSIVVGGTTVGTWTPENVHFSLGDGANADIGKRTAGGPTYFSFLSVDELHLDAVADASAAGSITHRVEVFDRDGNTLGFAYLYDS